MDFRYIPSEQEYRMEVRNFVKENLPRELRDMKGELPNELLPLEDGFMKKMVERGWIGLAFPKEYGGLGETSIPMNEYILLDELMHNKATLPALTYTYLVGTIGNTLLRHGSEELKKEFLPRIVNADIRLAICYTEPEAGNDLASLQTKAVEDGDDYIVNGQKRFITKADIADYMWAAIRTDPELPKHKGVSIMMINTKLPGITISPMRMATGTRTNEVFFDNVRVPKRYLVGERGRGFYYMMEALDRERFTMINFVGTSRPYEEFVEWLRGANFDGEKPKDNPSVRARVANMRLKMQAGRMMQLIAGSRGMTKDYVPNVEAAAIRHWEGLLSWENVDLFIDAARLYGCLDESEDAPREGRWIGSYKIAGHSWGSGGGVDINRKIIAQRGLGLPPW